MSRNPLIEAIHDARYDLETCSPNEQAACRGRLEELVQKAIDIAHSKLSVAAVLDALYDDYKDFRRMKRRQQWPKL